MLSRTKICPLGGRVLVFLCILRKIQTKEHILYVSLLPTGALRDFVIRSTLAFIVIYVFGRIAKS